MTNRYQLLCIIYVTFGSFFYGYDSGVTTSVIGYPSFLAFFNLNSTLLGALGSAYYGGSFIGVIFNMILANKIGRLRIIQVACVFALLGAALQTGAHNFATFLVGRIVGGFASGIMFAICPIYASEIATPSNRGRVGSIYGMNANAAYMVTEWLGLGFSYVSGNASWQILIGLQMLPALAMLVLSFWMPFSPRWLVLRGRYDEAKEVLKAIHGDSLDDTFYLREFHQIKAQIELELEEKLGLFAILKKPSYRHRWFLVAGFALASQLTGIIPVTAYQVIIYNKIGLGGSTALVLAGVWGTVTTLSGLGIFFIADKLGRRPILFIGYGFMIVGGLILVITWSQFDASGQTNVNLGRAMIFGIMVFGTGYGGPMNAFMAIYPGEICPTSIRSVGVATNYLIFNGMNIMLAQVTPLAIDAISWRFFLIFLVCSIVFIIIAFFTYPETKGKTLEEIAGIFGDTVAESLEEAAGSVAEKEFASEYNEIATPAQAKIG